MAQSKQSLIAQRARRRSRWVPATKYVKTHNQLIRENAASKKPSKRLISRNFSFYTR